MAKADLADLFTTKVEIKGEIFVPLEEVRHVIPADANLAWLDPETEDLLMEMKTHGVSGLVIIWDREENVMKTISSVHDPIEIAEACEHTARRYRDPAWSAERQVVELSKVRTH